MQTAEEKEGKSVIVCYHRRRNHEAQWLRAPSPPHWLSTFYAAFNMEIMLCNYVYCSNCCYSEAL